MTEYVPFQIKDFERLELFVDNNRSLLFVFVRKSIQRNRMLTQVITL